MGLGGRSKYFRHTCWVAVQRFSDNSLVSGNCPGSDCRFFWKSTDFETAIRLAISLGGDSDTLACITGGIAEAFYGMSEDWKIEVLRRLPEAFVEVVEEFYQKI